MEVVIAALLAQMGVIGLLFRWQHVQTRDNKLRIDKMAGKIYSKEETNEMIDLKLQPLAVGISHVQEELREVKSMIGRLLDEKNKG
jgi:hypothetical protein